MEEKNGMLLIYLKHDCYSLPQIISGGTVFLKLVYRLHIKGGKCCADFVMISRTPMTGGTTTYFFSFSSSEVPNSLQTHKNAHTTTYYMGTLSTNYEVSSKPFGASNHMTATLLHFMTYVQCGPPQEPQEPLYLRNASHMLASILDFSTLHVNSPWTIVATVLNSI